MRYINRRYRNWRFFDQFSLADERTTTLNLVQHVPGFGFCAMMSSMLTPSHLMMFGLIVLVAFFLAQTLGSNPKYARRSILLGGHGSERIDYWERLAMIVLALIALAMVLVIHHK